MCEVTSSVAKGNALEDSFHDYLNEQICNGELAFGIYPPKLCRLYKKKRYFCKEREKDIEFDVVLEIYRENSDTPHQIVFFECKNYDGHVPEREITDFSDKIGRIARDGGKGVIVTKSSLQEGAFNVAKSRRMGVVKYSPNGVSFILDRKSTHVSDLFLKKQLEAQEQYIKALKFSSFYNESFFSCPQHFIQAITGVFDAEKKVNQSQIPYVPRALIEEKAQSVLQGIGYERGEVDLDAICQNLDVSIIHDDRYIYDNQKREVLGEADFVKREIRVFAHSNKMRERFSISHEIGHFALQHDQYMDYECIIEDDLTAQNGHEGSLNELEYQANYFASSLLLPTGQFLEAVGSFREELNIRDRGHGYIYVDNQSCNYTPYNLLLGLLSDAFNVSKAAVEIKLDRLNLLADDRKKT